MNKQTILELLIFILASKAKDRKLVISREDFNKARKEEAHHLIIDSADDKSDITIEAL